MFMETFSPTLHVLSSILLFQLASSTLLANEEYCPSEALIFPDENHKIIGLNKSGEIEYSSKNNHIFRHSEKINNNGTCPCLVKSCVALCCPQSHRIYKNNCVEMNETRRIKFPQVFDSLTLEISNSNQLDLINDRDSRFHLFIWDPCHGEERWRLAPWENPDDEFKFLNNGSIYLTGASENDNHIIKFEDYCLGYIDGDSFSVVRCFQNDYYDYEEESENSEKRVINGIVGVGLVLSVPFLVATFLVYSILPELGNIHGFTLRGYVGPLSVAYSGLGILQLVSGVNHHPGMCYSLAFIIHFSFLSSFFWLNVMCFDIWWTFGGFRALQGSVKQRERKKFIIYSIYAWGCASIMTGICLIMDFAPGIPDHYIKPSFGQLSCWFKDDYAKAIYFYGPMGITVLCNIFLFISTALKILKHKRDTAHQLRGMDSRRHDDNKQWFNLYLKLFIVMGINWSMEIISWLCKDTPQYVWYITDLANTLQGVIIFIIFVWKDKIKRLLLKRFVCQNRNFQSRNSTRSGYHSSASNRTCNSTVMASLHDKNRPSSDKNRGTTTDESDCV